MCEIGNNIKYIHLLHLHHLVLAYKLVKEKFVETSTNNNLLCGVSESVACTSLLERWRTYFQNSYMFQPFILPHCELKENYLLRNNIRNNNNESM